MSLKINNLATDKQKKLFIEHGYIGTGQYVIDNLNKQQAADLITEFFEEERLDRVREEEFNQEYLGDDDPFRKGE